MSEGYTREREGGTVGRERGDTAERERERVTVVQTDKLGL